MENTLVKTTEEIVNHVAWSLDLRSPIHVREESFQKWYPLYGNYSIVNEHVVHATQNSFKHISEEGFISIWHDHVDPIPTTGFILVIEEGYRKEFGGDTPEENCRWQLNELYIL
jgi:hypothetical protein